MSYSPAPPGVTEHTVLVLGTGGTIASEPTSKGYAPISEPWARDIFFKRIRQHPQLSDAPAAVFAKPVEPKRDSHNNGSHDLRYPKLRTPPLNEKDDVVVYEILDLENHMDSSEMTPKGESTISVHKVQARHGLVRIADRASLRAIGISTQVHPQWSSTMHHPRSCDPCSGEANVTRLEQDRSAHLPELERVRWLRCAFGHRYAGVHVLDPELPLRRGWQADCRDRSADPAEGAALRWMVQPPRESACGRHAALCRCRCRLLSSVPAGMSRNEGVSEPARCVPDSVCAAMDQAERQDLMPNCKAVIISAFGSGNMPVKEETGVLQALENAVKRELLVVVISACE
ncbi:asparaginase [Trichosporon asahii var. asahii CBS 2479]|uniref:asparaginase n=1 Tax=Trichosporon asahii var. asahii (strain ATCC 90039 / CBS 2479 / JCM 2466 / KCTC 7840 / NBRC 103889/ NCYC 2677 / UAMH 7654) TaxID=1186058 RepID=J4UJY8_TRIAS|nr:asparaginase [Trichosporon asahii var. asahii CBS 2479]EJT52150.1 asparaginase [Trichosporon asahii var. asahii CBS 2479]